MSHGDKNVLDVDKYGAQAHEQDIAASMNLYALTKDMENERNENGK